MDDIRLKVKNTNIKEIFSTMEYGNITENVDLATTWFKNNETFELYTRTWDTSPSPIPIHNAQTGETLANITYSRVLAKYEDSSDSTRERCWRLTKLADELQKNTDLICQIEIQARGILVKDTKKELALLIECLQYYSGYEDSKGMHCEGAFSNETSIAMIGYFLGPAIANRSISHISLCPELKLVPICSLIIQLAIQVGISKCFMLSKVPSGKFVINFGGIPNSRPFTKSIFDGKIPMIVFNSADLDSACKTAIDAAWSHQGLLPWSVNTILVQEDIMEEFTTKLKYTLSKIKIGHANDKLADISFPTLLDDYEVKMHKYIKDATLQGIEVYRANESNTFQPTLFIGGMVYGNNVIIEDTNVPSITILAFRNANEAVALANNRKQGLAASLWTENGALAYEVSKKLKVGTVWINTFGQFNGSLSFTPQKDSGYGYFGGSEGSFVNDAEPPTVYPHSITKIKNMHATVMAAKKAQASWSSQSLQSRGKRIRSFAQNIEDKKNILCKSDTELKVLEDLISNLNACSTQLFYPNNTSIQGNYDIKSYREPVGVIVMEGFLLAHIPMALVQGNAIVCVTDSSLIFALSKLLPDLIHYVDGQCLSLIDDKDVNLIMFEKHIIGSDDQLKRKSQVIRCDNSNPDINNVTKMKNIWSDNKESFL